MLVAGLLLVGTVVEADGLYEAAGARLARVGGGTAGLLAALLGLDAVVSAVLNLDTAAIFVTPIVLRAAREREADERPFLYGALFMANGASILLPGSNLTNMIVLAHEPLTGADVARAMALPWFAVVVLTIAFVGAAFRPHASVPAKGALPPLRLGLGAAATAAAIVLMLALRNPAPPVLAVGVAAMALRRLRPRIGATVLAGLFVLVVALGTLARLWHGPARLIAHAGAIGDAVIGAGASVVVNNLPAAALLSAVPPHHPLPLLLGLDLGPNLAFTGSLSAYLWWRAARANGARPSLRFSSLLALVLVPVELAAALAALAFADPARW